MAKKRKKEKAEVEQYEFRPPEFNEKEFMKREMLDIRTALITVALAIGFGLIAGVVSLVDDSLMVVAFLLGIGGVFSLRYFYLVLKVDTSKFQKKNWAGNIASFFFTFLAIWVLMLNMPFSDHADPVIEKVIVWVDDGTAVVGIEYKYVETRGVYDWVSMNPNYSAGNLIHATANYTVNITAAVSDNGELSSVMVSVRSQSATPAPMTGEGEGRYGLKVNGNDPAISTTLMFYISATDGVGNSAAFSPTSGIPVLP